MSRRYLFGPVTRAFADQCLRRQRQAGDCLAFGKDGPDLTIGPNDSWQTVLGRLPHDWRPDFVALYLPYTTVPGCLWSAPVPLVGLAADWNLQWHYFRRCLPRCDRVLTDTAGVEALGRIGIRHARPAVLYGCDRDYLEQPYPDGPRDIDILFVGNLHPAVQRERLPWLARLARLSERYRVSIRTGVFGAAYRALLGRARIVFNRSIRGECNRRVFEAAAGGALLFQEEGNLEVPAYFHDRRECVYYNDDNLEALLEYYVEHEDERAALAAAARERVQGYSFSRLWDEQVALLEADWDQLTARVGQRPCLSDEETMSARLWQALGSSDGIDPGLVPDLAAALIGQPQSASLHNTLGLAVALAARGQGPTSAAIAEQAAGYFRRALDADPGHVVAGVNLVEALVGAGREAQAADVARRTLAALERRLAPSPLVGEGWGGGVESRAPPPEPSPTRGEGEEWDSPHFPPAFDHFRVEWERAAWANAGDPAAEARAKRDLLRWRLHAPLGHLTGQLHHDYEAVLARPDLPTTRASLGAALGIAGRHAEAVRHLEHAAAGNPFDLDTGIALFEAQGHAGHGLGQRRTAREYRRRARAAPQAVPPDNGFASVPPVGDELASILVLCHNQLPLTRDCLESVFGHTRAPYELVIVDNGSTDGTAEYLADLQLRSAECGVRSEGESAIRNPQSAIPGCVRLHVIRNPENRGFPAGCNQALAAARGAYTVFLNNDTVVTEGWLDGLIGPVLHDWPKVGMVGAVTNAASPPQHVPVDYTGLSGLAAFAARRRRAYAGKTIEFPRLTGFCLLARREVLEQVGGFDERYGLGFFDDDDLCLRVRQAGYKLLVAQDVFIHHFGSRTFKALGVDTNAQLRTNFEQFQAKWGPEHAAGYRLGGPEPSADDVGPDVIASSAAPGNLAEFARIRPSPRILANSATECAPPRTSLVMMVKNEARNLPACLASVAGLFDEIIIVDTGSTDETREIARRYGAKVIDFRWVDSFAAARNEGLRHAAGRYVFWMDADDRLDEENRRKLEALLDGLAGEPVAYAMPCLCVSEAGGDTETVVQHVRLFPNLAGLRWNFRVHEQILPGLRALGCPVQFADVMVHHHGYRDPAVQEGKRQRNLRLLLLEQAEQPDHPFTLFNLGCAYHEMRRPAEALPLFERSLARSQPGDSIVRKLHALIAQCLRHLGRTAEALAACRRGRTHYPHDAELAFQEGLARRQLGDAGGAEACLLRCLNGVEEPHFESVHVGIRGYLTRHNLAALCVTQGRLAEAEALWRRALDEKPDYLPAWTGLGELYLAQARAAELDRLIAHLVGQPWGAAEAAHLRHRSIGRSACVANGKSTRRPCPAEA
jgi:GT2 family glycosyltransferase